MAQRRMFSPDIVESEEFLTMPISSQALYFHLGMGADDDGFIQPKLLMKMLGANDDDLRVLLAKRFLLPFKSGVVVIKHWLIHNMIRSDRYKPTRFQNEKKLLKIKENKAYTEDNRLGCQNDNQMAPQVRLGKDRLGKENTGTPAEFGLPIIGFLIKSLKSSFNLISPDGTQEETRRYAHLLIKNKITPQLKAEGLEPTEGDVESAITALFSKALKDPFHRKQATSVKYFYYNFNKLLNL